MTTFDNREKAFENKFALDAETRFKAEARASKKLGLWAAAKLGLSGDDAETYAKSVVASNLDEAGFDDVISFVESDTQARGAAIARAEITAQMDLFFTQSIAELQG